MASSMSETESNTMQKVGTFRRLVHPHECSLVRNQTWNVM